jgi:enoyl-CoA hydratase
MAIHYDTDGPIAVVTIDRPEVANAVDRPTAEALAEAFRRFDSDEGAAVAVLTGAGGRFCAGADLKAMQEPGAPRASRVEPDGDGPVGPTRMLLGKPVIAAVEGNAVAGGLELAIWCDLRVAAEDAVFGVYCRRWGIPLMDGGTVRLARLIGHSQWASQTGSPPRGRRCRRRCSWRRRWPLVLRRPLRSDRLSSYEQWPLSLADALQNEYRHGMATLQTGEMFEGLARYESGAWRQEAP